MFCTDMHKGKHLYKEKNNKVSLCLLLTDLPTLEIHKELTQTHEKYEHIDTNEDIFGEWETEPEKQMFPSILSPGRNSLENIHSVRPSKRYHSTKMQFPMVPDKSPSHISLSSLQSVAPK